jgi:nitroreductase
MTFQLAQAGIARLNLPKPKREANAFLQLLEKRRSSRAFSDRPLEAQMLADLLWAAFGISNPDGFRTAPSARNWREIEIYAALASGLYRFNAVAEDLEEILKSDLRVATGHQDFVGTAPVNLVYVADHDRMAGASPKERDFYAAADAGAICQNVYLFCASAGLSTVVRGLIDRPALATQMRLRPAQRVILAQTVGYPAS